MNDDTGAAHFGRPYFGIDAPPRVILAYAALGAVGVAIIVASALTDIWLAGLGILSVIGGFGTAGLMLYSSLHGKIRARDRLLDELQFRGGEHVLDVGCREASAPPCRWVTAAVPRTSTEPRASPNFLDLGRLVVPLSWANGHPP